MATKSTSQEPEVQSGRQVPAPEHDEWVRHEVKRALKAKAKGAVYADFKAVSAKFGQGES